MNLNKICVYDYETDGRDPTQCNPVQLAAVIIDPRKLDFVQDAFFNSDMRPTDFDDPDYFGKHKDTIEWHAETQKCSVANVMERWKNAPDQQQVWNAFVQWLSKYHSRQARQSKFSAPVRAGYNISDFDDVITKRLAEKYGNVEKDGTVKLFQPRDRIDILHIVFWWFENQNEPKKYTMDTIREFLGMSSKNAHDALQDVYDEGAILIKLLKTQRWVTNSLIAQGKLGKKTSE